MNIRKLQLWTPEQLTKDIEKGGYFVVYPYTISLLIVTFRNASRLYYISSNEKSAKHAWLYIILNFFLGWWGFPYGILYTISSLSDCVKGGIDVTSKVSDYIYTGRYRDYDTKRALGDLDIL